MGVLREGADPGRHASYLMKKALPSTSTAAQNDREMQDTESKAAAPSIARGDDHEPFV
jgi:hypothetical protein